MINQKRYLYFENISQKPQYKILMYKEKMAENTHTHTHTHTREG